MSKLVGLLRQMSGDKVRIFPTYLCVCVCVCRVEGSRSAGRRDKSRKSFRALLLKQHNLHGTACRGCCILSGTFKMHQPAVQQNINTDVRLNHNSLVIEIALHKFPQMSDDYFYLFEEQMLITIITKRSKTIRQRSNDNTTTLHMQGTNSHLFL